MGEFLDLLVTLAEGLTVILVLFIIFLVGEIRDVRKEKS